MVPEFRKPQWRTLRTVVFAGVALSGLVPIAHGIWLHGADRALYDMGAIWYLIEGLFYLTGAIVYAVCSLLVLSYTIHLVHRLLIHTKASLPRDHETRGFRHMGSRPSDHAHHRSHRRSVPFASHSHCNGLQSQPHDTKMLTAQDLTSMVIAIKLTLDILNNTSNSNRSPEVQRPRRLRPITPPSQRSTSTFHRL